MQTDLEWVLLTASGRNRAKLWFGEKQTLNSPYEVWSAQKRGFAPLREAAGEKPPVAPEYFHIEQIKGSLHEQLEN